VNGRNKSGHDDLKLVRLYLARYASRQIRRRQMFERLVLEILVEAPALDLRQHLVEFGPRDRPIDETLAATEARKIPRVDDIGDLERVQRLASAPHPSNAASNALAIASLLLPARAASPITVTRWSGSGK
jgi:hypothetical protein